MPSPGKLSRSFVHSESKSETNGYPRSAFDGAERSPKKPKLGIVPGASLCQGWGHSTTSRDSFAARHRRCMSAPPGGRAIKEWERGWKNPDTWRYQPSGNWRKPTSEPLELLLIINPLRAQS